ncbi:NFACT RNA binding domain-containing protein [Synechococcus lacustris]|uniref:Rqc2 family fibronectin-binding protein n=1 Tax=Synechococcus TaxID=1129 RepID=UPI0028F45D0F|nr:NFACT RNA binding domain-containing protein [Synechococcus lacustris]
MTLGETKAMQPQDTTCLKAVVTELQPLLLPARFEKAQQPCPGAVQLGFRTLSQRLWLELRWQADAARFHCLPAPARLGEGSTMAQQLQHGLSGLALVSLQQPPWERVVQLGFAERPGGSLKRQVVIELMGRHSNLFLLDEQDQVIAIGRQVQAHQSRLRPIGTGDSYSPPPPLQGAIPSLNESFEQWRQRLSLRPETLAKAMLQSYRGLGPALRDQLLQAAGLSNSDLVNELGESQWLELHQAWCHWLRDLDQGQLGFTPWGEGYRCWGSNQQTDHQANKQAEPRLNYALAAFYAAGEKRRQWQLTKQKLSHQLGQLLGREQRELQQQEELLSRCAGESLLQKQADLLLCRPDVASTGHQQLLLADPAGGASLAVELNPQLSLVFQAQKFYKKARKLRRSVAAIEPRLSYHRRRLELLENSLLQLELANPNDLELLEALQTDLSPFQATGSQTKRLQRHQEGEPQPMALISPGGLRLLVGRNHRQNDWISFRQARRGDLWFHAQEQPGSHVVLKGSEQLASEADLQAAANLAAHFSRSRGNARVPVVMVPVEQLQRIPGMEAGLVRHGGGEIIWAEPDRALALLPSLRQ